MRQVDIFGNFRFAMWARIYHTLRMGRDAVTEILSANISRFMEERGINATELAERSGLNRTAIYDILANRSQSPRVKTVSQIADALRVPISDMFLTAEQVEGQNALFAAYQALPPQERERLQQIAQAWLPKP